MDADPNRMSESWSYEMATDVANELRAHMEKKHGGNNHHRIYIDDMYTFDDNEENSYVSIEFPAKISRVAAEIFARGIVGARVYMEVYAPGEGSDA